MAALPYNEFVTVFDGSVTSSLDGENPVSLRPGDSFFVPKGARIRWHIHETVSKYLVICGDSPVVLRRELTKGGGQNVIASQTRLRSSGWPADPGLQRTGHRTSHRSGFAWRNRRSEEHTSELPSLTRNSNAVFCLKQKKP